MNVIISIKPKFVKDILLGSKTIELRKFLPSEIIKSFKKGNEINFYIYCCKNKNKKDLIKKTITYLDLSKREIVFNSKIIATFKSKKIEQIYNDWIVVDEFNDCDELRYFTNTINENKLLELSKVNIDELYKYDPKYLISIEDLQILKPKDLIEFGLRKPPQNMQILKVV